MLIDLSPLKKNRDYRLLFLGQFVSLFGSMITYVAVPYQVYELTKSSALVGLLGVAQLVPILFFGIIGGSVADTMNRRKLLIYSEIIMSLCALGLALNAHLKSPSVVCIFLLCALMQAANGFHRPAMDALTQKFVDEKDYASIGALGGFRYSVGSILGPSLGGVLIAAFGAPTSYWIDFLTFIASLFFIASMSKIPNPTTTSQKHLQGIRQGIQYALSRPVLLGTYIVDIVAMTFAFPVALFPEMSTQWGGAKAAGILFSAMSIGSLVMTVFSGWTSQIKRHGAAVVIAAGIWGVAIIALAYAPNLWVAVSCLVVAGAADMVSGLFRGIIWNESIPNEMRGRLSGIEMISYMSGPLLGNARSGWMAARYSIHHSILWGGVACVAGVMACGVLLPKFWKYTSRSEADKKT